MFGQDELRGTGWIGVSANANGFLSSGEDERDSGGNVLSSNSEPTE